PLLKYIFMSMIKLQSEAVDALTDLNEDEYFDPCDDVDEIEPLLHHDPSTPKISIALILEGFTDGLPLKENEELFDLETKENK
nr:hypothetical protein [Tanacetum cinerariifolium]